LVAESGEFLGKVTVGRRLHHAVAADDGPSLLRCRGSEADAPAIWSMNLADMLRKASVAGGSEEGADGRQTGRHKAETTATNHPDAAAAAGSLWPRTKADRRNR
jgi:hypothetical protein